MVAAADHAVADALRRHGRWNVLTSGWPDLLCYSRERNTVMAVELKRGNDKLRPDQIEMMSVFVDLFGVPFHVARDKDIEGLMAKTGRVMLPGRSLLGLQAERDALQFELARMNTRVAGMSRLIDETTAVFEQVRACDVPTVRGPNAPVVDVRKLLGDGPAPPKS